MDFTKATVTIVGIAPLSQSHMHGEPKLEGESHDAYDERTWRSKLNVDMVNGKETVIIPTFGMQTAIADAAKYSKKKIEGKGNSTWTAKFVSGIAVMGPVSLGIDPAAVKPITILANADGVRGSGKRVTRRFPQMMSGWKATFDVIILDEVITEDIFSEMMRLAGLFIGVGQFRPQKGGTNGRFNVEKIVWHDARQKVPAKARAA